MKIFKEDPSGIEKELYALTMHIIIQKEGLYYLI